MIQTKEIAEKNEIVRCLIEVTYSNSLDEILTVSTASEGGGMFYKIETEKWSFDTVEEMIDVLNDFKNLANIIE